MLKTAAAVARVGSLLDQACPLQLPQRVARALRPQDQLLGQRPNRAVVLEPETEQHLQRRRVQAKLAAARIERPHPRRQLNQLPRNPSVPGQR